ncbi:PRC and DUF2382 domain-containing protein [Streptomyces pinistramenti]|uniref:PRC and DUF2382 domain-containing protein n=1 Tax=Streptomyces pinistramenti TaxID=2884812 RepID=UPI001D07C29D|nr:PRC and DUF2382 domain-containing protein [Streptomyces pinistramenti]MCB5908439.1 PRC and DUF2382 domain-containing protein [Streptomyces pinistramenti]
MNAPLGDTPQDLTGLNVVDAEGAKVGAVQQVYRDDATNIAEWITVRTGLFGMKETFVPLAGARRVDDELHVPHTKETIKEAPRIDADGHLDPSEEEELYRHYGLTRPGTAPGTMKGADTGSPAGTGNAGMTGTGRAAGGAAGMAAAGTGGDARRARTPAGDRDRAMAEGAGTLHKERTDRPLAGAGAGGMAMSRGRGEGETAGREQVPEILLSEEQMQIGTEEHESGRAHLRKRVVTEDVHRTIPISHEEVRMVRERITEDERLSGRTAPRIGDGEVEVVLHEEQAVVSKKTVPVERVRLETERVTEQKEVNVEIRTEQLEFDDGRTSRKGERKGPGPDRRR